MKSIKHTRLGEIYVRREADIVKVRDRVRRLAHEMRFDPTTQIKITTAISELTRNIYEYASAGTISLGIAERDYDVGMLITARDDGPGIDEATLAEIMRGTYRSTSGLGVGLQGTRRLMDEFLIESAPQQGTLISVVKWLPRIEASQILARVEELRASIRTDIADSAVDELQRQNKDLIEVLAELEEKRTALEVANDKLAQSNAELQEANTRLRELSDMKEEFLALTTHDLRSPLTVISGVINFFTSGRLGELSPEQKKMVAMMERNTHNLIELINDLLDASKLEAGSMRMEATEIDLARFAREVCEPFESLAREKEIKLTIELPTEIPCVRADRSKLRRIFINLLSNALKFTLSGGSVHIGARHEEGFVRVSVKDTGVGIAPDDLQRLFDKYEQTRNRATRGEKGTGLGLYIAKQLVELQGGAIEIQSTPGIGSEFSFTVPVATSAARLSSSSS